MIIKLITSDFKGSRYISNTDCPFARALKRLFPNMEVRVGGRTVRINGESHCFTHEQWDDEIVNPLIKSANAGNEVTYELEIPGLTL